MQFTLKYYYLIKNNNNNLIIIIIIIACWIIDENKIKEKSDYVRLSSSLLSNTVSLFHFGIYRVLSCYPLLLSVKKLCVRGCRM